MPKAGAGSPAAVEQFAEPAAVLGRGRWRPAEVPRIGTPGRPASGPAASFSGVCPPSVTITPATVPDCCSACNDFQHVLGGQRLEIQPVGGVVVGGHRLRVAVDHDGLEPGVPQRQRGVDAGVVELDALADPVRPGAQDDHLWPLGLRRHLGLGARVGLVGRVVVRRARLELRGAGVHGLEHRADPGRPTAGPGPRLGVGDASPPRPQAAICRSDRPYRLAVRSRSSSSSAASRTSLADRV